MTHLPRKMPKMFYCGLISILCSTVKGLIPFVLLVGIFLIECLHLMYTIKVNYKQARLPLYSVLGFF